MMLNYIESYDWSEKKNLELLSNRGIGFIDILNVIACPTANRYVVGGIDHYRKDKYPTQMILLVCLERYVYLVPFVVEGEKAFLKTIIPSRKYTKLLLRK